MCPSEPITANYGSGLGPGPTPGAGGSSALPEPGAWTVGNRRLSREASVRSYQNVRNECEEVTSADVHYNLSLDSQMFIETPRMFLDLS